MEDYIFSVYTFSERLTPATNQLMTDRTQSEMQAGLQLAKIVRVGDKTIRTQWTPMPSQRPWSFLESIFPRCKGLVNQAD